MEKQSTAIVNTQTGEILSTGTEIVNLRKEGKQFTSAGRKVANFTCVLYFPDGRVTTYRSDTEHQKMVEQKLLHPAAPEYMAVIKRFEEFAHEACKAFIFDNTRNVRMVKAVFGKITYNVSNYFAGKHTVVADQHKKSW